jgi:hypothetical protein
LFSKKKLLLQVVECRRSKKKLKINRLKTMSNVNLTLIALSTLIWGIHKGGPCKESASGTVKRTHYFQYTLDDITVQ